MTSANPKQVRLPASLLGDEFAGLQRVGEMIILLTSDKQSYELGRYFRAETDVTPKLSAMLGFNKTLAEEAVIFAGNYGVAYIDIAKKEVRPALFDDQSRDVFFNREFQKKMRKDSGEEDEELGNTYIEQGNTLVGD